MHSAKRSTAILGLFAAAAIFAAGCSSAAATAAPTAASSVDAAAATPTAAGPAGAASLTIGSTADATLGAYLTGMNGMTLYVLTKDTPDTSSCSGGCATNWPPLSVASGATITGPSGATMAFATITRADGIVQATYNHMPLYYFAGDSAAGDTKGQGSNGVWFVAPVSGKVGAVVPSTAPAVQAATPAASAPAGY